MSTFDILGLACLSLASIGCGLFLFLLGHRAGFERGVQIGSSPNIDFLRHIKLPTSDEVKKQAEERFPL